MNQLITSPVKLASSINWKTEIGVLTFAPPNRHKILSFDSAYSDGTTFRFRCFRRQFTCLTVGTPLIRFIDLPLSSSFHRLKSDRRQTSYFPSFIVYGQTAAEILQDNSGVFNSNGLLTRFVDLRGGVGDF
ncbi:hypothetical protein L1887_43236 [Cichorium endivia]|nr:hypothetical protein L1887_43236 [Cichorium endivia]